MNVRWDAMLAGDRVPIEKKRIPPGVEHDLYSIKRRTPQQRIDKPADWNKLGTDIIFTFADVSASGSISTLAEFSRIRALQRLRYLVLPNIRLVLCKFPIIKADSAILCTRYGKSMELRILVVNSPELQKLLCLFRRSNHFYHLTHLPYQKVSGS